MLDLRRVLAGIAWLLLPGLHACDTFGSAPDRTACSNPSECTLIDNACCGTCGALSLDNVTAINRRSLDEQRAEQCGEDLFCNPIFCPAQAPLVVATCRAGRCTAIPLTREPVAACVNDADCHVRATACCECGASTDPGRLVAVSDRGAFGALVCGPDTACPECEASYPEEVTASCIAGSCQILDRRADLPR